MGKLKINTPDGVYEKNVGETAAADAIGELKDVVAQIYQAVSKGSGGIRYITESNIPDNDIEATIGAATRVSESLPNYIVGKTRSISLSATFSVTSSNYYRSCHVTGKFNVTLPNAVTMPISNAVSNASKCAFSYIGERNLQQVFYANDGVFRNEEEMFIGTPLVKQSNIERTIVLANIQQMSVSSKSLLFWFNTNGAFSQTFSKEVTFSTTSFLPTTSASTSYTNIPARIIQSMTHNNSFIARRLGIKSISLTEYM